MKKFTPEKKATITMAVVVLTFLCPTCIDLFSEPE